MLFSLFVAWIITIFAALLAAGAEQLTFSGSCQAISP